MQYGDGNNLSRDHTPRSALSIHRRLLDGRRRQHRLPPRQDPPRRLRRHHPQYRTHPLPPQPHLQFLIMANSPQLPAATRHPPHPILSHFSKHSTPARYYLSSKTYASAHPPLRPPRIHINQTISENGTQIHRRHSRRRQPRKIARFLSRRPRPADKRDHRQAIRTRRSRILRPTPQYVAGPVPKKGPRLGRWYRPYTRITQRIFNTSRTPTAISGRSSGTPIGSRMTYNPALATMSKVNSGVVPTHSTIRSYPTNSGNSNTSSATTLKTVPSQSPVSRRKI